MFSTVLEVPAFSQFRQGAALPGLQRLPEKLCAGILVKEKLHHAWELQVLETHQYSC